MAFTYAYSLGGGMSSIIDFPLDTTANYKTAGTNAPTKGDAVFLNAGLVRRTNQAAPYKVVGVLEGIEFKGLADGGTYAATNSSFNSHVVDATNFTNGVAKVRVDNDAVYKVNVLTGSATAANIGVAYGINVAASGDQTIDLASVTASQTPFKVLALTYATGSTTLGSAVYVVQFTNPQIV